MDVKEAIRSRRAYRSLVPIKITEELIQDLGECAQLAPSCFNNQPWRYVFVYDKEKLKQLHSALTPANKWVHAASLIIAVYSETESIFEIAVKKMNLSARSFFKILKVSRTIADLETSDSIKKKHLLEALSYKNLQRNYDL